VVYALQNSGAVGFAELAAQKGVKQVPLGGKLVSLTLSNGGGYAHSSAQEQDKIFVISLAEQKVVPVVETPKGSGPDPVIALQECRSIWVGNLALVQIRVRAKFHRAAAY